MRTNQNNSNAFPKLVTWLFLGALAIQSTGTAPAGLVSLRDPAVSPITVGNADSIDPSITPDGRFVVFSSAASDLVPGDNDFFTMDVFLRDRVAGTTTLVSESVTGSGGNGDSTAASVSTNGQFVVYQSDATNIVSGDTNAATDVFLNDLVNNVIYTISVATNGLTGNGASTDLVMTPDGRYVAFISSANNLVPNDTNNIPDVFVRDVLNGTTVCASAGAVTNTTTATVMATPVITPDGRYVAFFSTAKGLASGLTNFSQGEIYVRDLVNNQTIWASTNAIALTWRPGSFLPIPAHPVISSDGRYVAFKSGATNSFPSAPDYDFILQFDCVANTTTIVSTNGLAITAYHDDVYGPEMTPDGRYVAFVSHETSPIFGTTTNIGVRVWDRLTGSNVLASIAMNGQFPSNTISEAPCMTPDGRFVAFRSYSTNLVTGTASNLFHIYVRDLQSGTTVLVDASTNGIATTDSYDAMPKLSADGRYVAFDSPDGKLVALDNNTAEDVFVRDTTLGTTELISKHSSSLPSYAGDRFNLSTAYSMSDDGRWVAFTSFADDLVENDTNRAPDVFVHDNLTGTNILVSVDFNGKEQQGNPLTPPVISGNGQYVAFVSSATNLVFNRPNPAANIFLRNLQTATTTLISVNSSGTAGASRDSSALAISADGRYVAFQSMATDLTPGSTLALNTYLRDTVLNITTEISSTNQSYTPTFSADGRYVSYLGWQNRVQVWDNVAGRNIYTNAFVFGGVSGQAICPTGTFVLYAITNAYVVDNFNVAFTSPSNHIGATNVITIPVQQTYVLGAKPKTFIKDSKPWSANGRYFVFVTDTNEVASDNNGTNDIYLYDMQTSSFTLVSLNAGNTGSGNNSSDSPVISGDGRFVAYRSFATDIVPGAVNPPNIYLYDQMTGVNTLLSTGIVNWARISENKKPAINTNGSVVLFESLGTPMNSGDQNRAQDIVSSARDGDGDSIPDFWTQYYFGHTDGQAGDLSRAGDDADGDGLSNLQEFLTGTNPTNAASAFHLAIAGNLNAANSKVLSWPASPGTTYHVQYKDNLTDALWLDSGLTIFFTGNQAYVIVPADQASRYYRLVSQN